MEDIGLEREKEKEREDREIEPDEENLGESRRVKEIYER